MCRAGPDLRVPQRGDKLSQSRITAKASVDELKAAVAAAAAQVDRTRSRLADRTIVAPFAGTPGFHSVDAGARVTKDTALTRLDDLDVVPGRRPTSRY